MTSKQRPKCVREKLRGFFHGPPWIFAWIFLWSPFPIFNGGWGPQKNPRKNPRSSITKSTGFFTDTFLMPFGKIHGVFHGHFWMPFGRHFGYLLGVILGCLSGIVSPPHPIWAESLFFSGKSVEHFHTAFMQNSLSYTTALMDQPQELADLDRSAPRVNF